MFKSIVGLWRLCIYFSSSKIELKLDFNWFSWTFLNLENKQSLKTIRAKVMKESTAIYSGFKVFNLFLQNVMHSLLQVLCLLQISMKKIFSKVIQSHATVPNSKEA